MCVFRYIYHMCFNPELMEVWLEVNSGLEKLRIGNLEQKNVRVKHLK